MYRRIRYMYTMAIRIMGLGGSIRYKKGINQYTQNQMRKGLL